MSANEVPLSLIIKAVDRATAPLRRINEQLRQTTAPVRQLGSSFKALGQESGISGLAEHVHKFGEKLSEAGRKVFELGKHLLEMEAVGGFALYELVKGSVEAGDKLAEMAQRTGLSVDAFASLRYAAGQAHISQEDFGSAMDFFNRQMGQARVGTGSLLMYLERMSPALAIQIRHAKTASEGFDLMAKAMSKLKHETDMAGFATQAFGRSGAQWGVFLHQGSAAIADQAKRYLELAGSQKVFAERSEETEKALLDTGAAFEGLKNAALAELMPALQQIAHEVATFLSEHREGLREWAETTGKAISEWVAKGGIQRLIATMQEIGKTIVTVIHKIGGLKGAFIALAVIMSGSVLASFVGVGASMVTLAPAIAKVALAINSFTFGPVLAAIGNFIIALRAGYSAMAALNLVMISNPVGAVIVGLTALAGVGYLVYRNWDRVKTLFEGLWEAMKHPIDALGSLGQMFKHPLDALGTAKDFWFGGSEKKSFDASKTAAAGPGGQNSAHVTVDFSNLPRGARVAYEKTAGTPINLLWGYSMMVPE